MSLWHKQHGYACIQREDTTRSLHPDLATILKLRLWCDKILKQMPDDQGDVVEFRNSYDFYALSGGTQSVRQPLAETFAARHMMIDELQSRI